MKRFLTFAVLIGCMYSVALWAGSEGMDKTYNDGLFQITLPSDFARVTGSLLDELKRTMLGGARELATASKTADPKEISEKWLSFLSAFQNPSRKLLVILMAAGPETVPMDREEMYKTNTQRITWGKESKRLSKNSKGVSRLMIDNIPCLLMDIETIGGARMLTYSFFLSKYPKHSFQVAISCDDRTCYEKNENDIATIVKSIKIKTKGHW